MWTLTTQRCPNPKKSKGLLKQQETLFTPLTSLLSHPFLSFQSSYYVPILSTLFNPPSLDLGNQYWNTYCSSQVRSIVVVTLNPGIPESPTQIKPKEAAFSLRSFYTQFKQ